MKTTSKHGFMRILAVFLVLFMITSITVSVSASESPYQTDVGSYAMTPISGEYLNDGIYEITVESNSTFFKIVHATLTVKENKMTASIEIASHSYPYLYLGTSTEAEQAAESEYIIPIEQGDSYIYTFPVSGLNQCINCSAFSKRRKKWYNRHILFQAASLPDDALTIELPDYDAIDLGLSALQNLESTLRDGETTENAIHGVAAGDAYTRQEALEVPYEDGEYSIEVSMAGGTGRASISSPTLMIVKDGRAYAKILMSSSHYDWMIAAGETYYNENTDGGNSYFIIPITAMDSLVNIIADTTAMGDPVAIQYTLTFYSETIGNKGQIPQEAAKRVIIVAASVIVAGGALNFALKKKKKH